MDSIDHRRRCSPHEDTLAALDMEKLAGPPFEEIFEILIAKGIPDDRDGVGKIRCRDGSRDVEPGETREMFSLMDRASVGAGESQRLA